MLGQHTLRPRAFHRVAFVAGSLVAVVGAAHLIAWVSGALSTGIGASTITMKANASLCLVLGGVALQLLSPRHPPTWARVFARFAAAVVLVVATLTLIEHVAQLDLGIDQLIAVEPAGAAATASPNRMGPIASCALIMLAVALLLIARRPQAGHRATHQPLAVLVAGLALMPLIGFLYGANNLYGVARYTGIAWPTAVSLLLLAVGVLCARPHEGLMVHVTADDAGGALVRRLLAPTIAVPIVFGWFRLAGERRGWFDAGTGTGLTMLLLIVTFSVILVLGGRLVRREAATRRQHEDAVRRQLAEIQSIYDSAHIGLCVFDRDLRYLRVNQLLADTNGLPPAEHLGKTIEEVVPALAPMARCVTEQIFQHRSGRDGRRVHRHDAGAARGAADVDGAVVAPQGCLGTDRGHQRGGRRDHRTEARPGGPAAEREPPAGGGRDCRTRHLGIRRGHGSYSSRRAMSQRLRRRGRRFALE